MENNRIGYIYVLYDPIFNIPKYIGQSVNPKSRLKRHIADSKNPKTYNKCWIKGLIDKELKPILEILDQCNIEDLDFWERHYISLYKSWGFRLTNLTEGGGANKILSIESRQRISNTLIGRKLPSEVILKKSVTMKEKWKDPEYLHKMLNRNQNNKHFNIYQIIDSNRIFIKTNNSVSKIAKEFNIDLSSVCKCLNKKLSRVKNYTFEYVN